MGRSLCPDKVGLKKGPWTPEEDQKLLACIEEHGHGSWHALPAKAGLQRCGKSCRLRWTNYLRPDIKRGKFSLQEEQTIIQLQALLGNRWSAIATHLPKRTDNEIKNYWNTHLKKRLDKFGADPLTHIPKSNAPLTSDGQSKTAANLSHMAQWESARLEAEARLVKQSKLRSNLLNNPLGSTEFAPASSPLNKPVAPPEPRLYLDILKAWNGVSTKPTKGGRAGGDIISLRTTGVGNDLESQTSTLSFTENAPAIQRTRIGGSPTTFTEFIGNSGYCDQGRKKEEGDEDYNHLHEHKDGTDSLMPFTFGLLDTTTSIDNSWTPPESPRTDHECVCGDNFVKGFPELLLNNSGGRSSSEGGVESIYGNDGGSDCMHYDTRFFVSD
ncbi:unnamed protein product [Ilex paraguariensis]|uniref:Uncharacterized protein n=1 Tax=Ilex paraguariensis TaxID=185542 RepID=A0ABC8T0H3_9AQUA